MEMAETYNNLLHKHPMDNPLPRYIVAGFLAIALHMTFLLFREVPDVDNTSSTNIKHVILLPLDTKLPSEQQLLEWMKIMDPMYVTKPDRKNGFSFVPELHKPKDQTLSMDKQFTQPKKRTFLPIPSPLESYRDKVRRFWDYTSAPVRKPLFSIVKRKEEDYPLWVLENGRILPQLFNNPDQVRSILKKQKLSLKETVIRSEFYGTGFFPRLKIDVSCGNSELDMLALKTFAVKGRKLLFESEKSDSTPLYIAVKWRIYER